MDGYARRKAEQKLRQAAKRRAPLRKIVGVWKRAVSRMDWQGVDLECGHTASASYGAMFRARCIECMRSNT